MLTNAKEIDQKIQDTVDLIGRFPEAGTQTVQDPVVRFWVVDQFKIYYELTDDAVVILRIFDTSRDIDKQK